MFPQLVFMLHYRFLQVRNLCLLLLDDAPQVFNTVMVGHLIFRHLMPAKVREKIEDLEEYHKETHTLNSDKYSSWLSNCGVLISFT